MDYVALVIGLMTGGVMGFLVAKRWSGAAAEGAPEEARLREALAVASERARQLEARCAEGKVEQNNWAQRLELSEQQKSRLEVEVARSRQEALSARAASEEKLAELKSARDQLVTTFRSTAAQLLQETRAQGVAEQQENLNVTLRPFQDQLKGFQELVSRTYSEELRDRASLKKEIELLALRHQSLAQEAQRLAGALTGSSKVRGDWGEITLTRILERSGLREGQEFRLQESTTLDDRSRLRPDVVVALPQDGALVIDSKLQLISWMKVCDAQTPEETSVAAAELVAAIRGHLRGLDRKAYSTLYKDSVELVVLYIPIDAALATAVSSSPELFEEASSRGVILTGPTLLMALLLTLAQQWRGRHQEQNVMKIARLAESLGEKLKNFLDSYQQLGARLRQGAEEYNKGLAQLATGKGNVLKKAADLGALGIKSARKLEIDWESMVLEVDGPSLVDSDSEREENPV